MIPFLKHDQALAQLRLLRVQLDELLAHAVANSGDPQAVLVALQVRRLEDYSAVRVSPLHGDDLLIRDRYGWIHDLEQGRCRRNGNLVDSLIQEREQALMSDLQRENLDHPGALVPNAHQERREGVSGVIGKVVQLEDDFPVQGRLDSFELQLLALFVEETVEEFVAALRQQCGEALDLWQAAHDSLYETQMLRLKVLTFLGRTCQGGRSVEQFQSALLSADDEQPRVVDLVHRRDLLGNFNHFGDLEAFVTHENQAAILSGDDERTSCFADAFDEGRAAQFYLLLYELVLLCELVLFHVGRTQN